MGHCPADMLQSNVVFFEHLFLGVKDMETAHAFYEDGLGLVYDPSVKTGQKKGVGVSWLNIGDQQFHIDVEEEVSRTPGPVRLHLPGLHSVQQQLQQCAARFAGTDFAVKADADPKQLCVTDPWGQLFLISEAEAKNGVAGAHIASLVFPCHQGTAAAIAQFYNVNLQAEASQGTDADGNSFCDVHLGYGTTFRFQEDSQLGPLSSQAAIKAYEGWHCAIYVSNFEDTYKRIVQAKLNYTDHPYKDKAYDLDAAKQWNQFRFQDIIAVEDSQQKSQTKYSKGQLLYRFGHEVRSLQHRRCPKILLKEPKAKAFRGSTTPTGTAVLPKV